MAAGMESLLIVIVFSLIFFPVIVSPLAAAFSSDTLRQGDRLDSVSNISSANDVFRLGFLAPGDCYLAIWFNTDQFLRPVWNFGNDNTQFDGNSCFLTIDSAGNLILSDAEGNRTELYRAPTGTNTTATLLDNGNFIVRDANNNNESAVLWQSFDYPTNTLLPGMKLGVNHMTGRNWTLTSWDNDEVGVPGAFTMEWDPTERRLIVRRRGIIF